MLVQIELDKFEDKKDDAYKRFEAIKSLAVNYRGCMETFGRLPFRNEVLGRENTEKEQIFIDENT